MHVIASFSVMPDKQSLGGGEGNRGQDKLRPYQVVPCQPVGVVMFLVAVLQPMSRWLQCYEVVLSHPEQTLFHSFVSEPERITTLVPRALPCICFDKTVNACSNEISLGTLCQTN